MSDTETDTSIVSVGPHRLEGILRRPADPIGLVIFGLVAATGFR